MPRPNPSPSPFSAAVPALLLAGLFLLSGCSQQRILRVGTLVAPPKAKDAPVDTFTSRLDRLYAPLAVIDSNTYDAQDPATREQMTEDVRVRARRVGADAVHNLRIVEVRKRGAVPDRQVPLPGAWMQGTYSRYRMRGEAVLYRGPAPKPEPPPAQ